MVMKKYLGFALLVLFFIFGTSSFTFMFAEGAMPTMTENDTDWNFTKEVTQDIPASFSPFSEDLIWVVLIAGGIFTVFLMAKKDFKVGF